MLQPSANQLLDIRPNACEFGQGNISSNEFFRFFWPQMCQPCGSSQGSLGRKFLSFRLDSQQLGEVSMQKRMLLLGHRLRSGRLAPRKLDASVR